jgi:peptidyl-prolyl cis-trans isomerase C
MGAQSSRVRRWLREPLVHFLALGLALFVVYRVVNSGAGGDRATRIELTQDDIKQLEVVWMAQWQRPPTPRELSGLVEARVREEVLYREALSLGLERGDTIVKRRLAQKMEFLSEDVAAIPEPTPEVLRAWFAQNLQRFALPGQVSFSHLYFAADRRGGPPREAAIAAMRKLAGKDSAAPIPAGVSDRFMYSDYYADRMPDQVASVFGRAFADSLFALEARRDWQGPIVSGFGWHLVRLESTTPGHVPPFDDVEADVKREWIADARAESKRRAFDAIRARYTVVVADGSGSTVAAAEPRGAARR